MLEKLAAGLLGIAIRCLPWLVRVINIILASAAMAAIGVFSQSLVTDQQTINLKSDWNVGVTLKIFAISFLLNFALAFSAYLKQSPLPEPDEESGHINPILK